jgi:hypothetical protein
VLRLSVNAHTRARSLSWNKLGPDGGAALAEGLKGNSTLQRLEYATRARTRPRVFAFASAPIDTPILELFVILPCLAAS